jgi:hypothetical protein
VSSPTTSPWTLPQRQTRGNPADPHISLEAIYIQDPGLEAQLVKFNFLNSYLDRGGIIERLKNASNCCLSRYKQENMVVIFYDNALI